ncbi:DUF4007 family protein [Syntrophomonas palmitatica]|uniref:DUF4007 family protein n=1 Tax=Syntrophomonas palmitatica TaxID=402877 RepID=UPI0006D17DE0|nr:DUF4007 family protein [Syntrophomonas palmitatica]
MLPINFHKTFIPERHFIAALLDYTALGKGGTLQEIAADTGIPMGKTNGKVPAILDYARGMGLIEVHTGSEKGVKVPKLTSLGRAVYMEDKYLGEAVTQWIVHMNLCRSDIGALAWNAVFNNGRSMLGGHFDKQQLEDYLVGICGPGNDRTGPLLRVYLEDAALERTRAIELNGDTVVRSKAPLLDFYAVPYSAFVLDLMESYFPKQNQVTLADLQNATGWLDICFWKEADIETVCLLMERKGYITIDRQRQPWIIEKLSRAEEIWPHIWDDL